MNLLHKTTLVFCAIFLFGMIIFVSARATVDDESAGNELDVALSPESEIQLSNEKGEVCIIKTSTKVTGTRFPC